MASRIQKLLSIRNQIDQIVQAMDATPFGYHVLKMLLYKMHSGWRRDDFPRIQILRQYALQLREETKL